MKRIFLAMDIIPDEEMVKHLEMIRISLIDSNINWVNVRHLHLTVKFFGATGEEMIPSISERIKKALQNKNSFNITLKSLGIFKSIEQAHVIWIGCESGSKIEEISRCIELQFPATDKTNIKNFKPHITLGRIKNIKSKDKLAILLSEYRDYSFSNQKIENITLYESVLHKKGPEYKELNKFMLY